MIEPQMAMVQVLLEKARKFSGISRAINDIFETEFGDVNEFCMELSTGKYPIC